MIRSRHQGLWQLHGVGALLLVPALFALYAYISARWLGRFHYELVNYGLYFLGTLVSGLLSMIYYPREYVIGDLSLQQVLRLTQRQTLILLMVMFSLVFATKDQGMSRIFLSSFIGLSSLMLFIFNRYVPRYLAQYVFGGVHVRSCVLVGSAERCAELEDCILAHKALGMSILGYVSYAASKGLQPHKIPYLGAVGALESILANQSVSQVILLETQSSKEWVRQVCLMCERNACRILIYNPWREYFDQPMIPIQEGIHTFFALKEEPLESPVNQALKRILDLVVAVPVVVSILPILCVLVKVFQMLEAPGPLFFKQERIGLNRKPFTIYKFRSMFHNDATANQSANQASEGDKRVFGFGLWIRRMSIDEFPQFWNVLMGHMSVVGPRPHYIGHDKLFQAYILQYRQRHFAKPGITGLAQVKGYRGEITDLNLLRERTHYDLDYIDHWSIELDISIIVRTIWHVVFPPKTAY